MKNYNKTVLILGILYFIAVAAFAVYTGQDAGRIPGRDTDIIKLNDITRDAERVWDSLEKLADNDYGVDYSVIDTADNLLYSSFPVKDEDMSLASAQKKGCIYACAAVDDKIAGYVILRDEGGGIWKELRTRIIAGLVIAGTVFAILAFLFGRYVQKTIITPFNNLKDFAGSIAEGNLDEPLKMHRDNMFGAFTESFDIMREELSASRKREIELQRRERELVASLSHDLKTPITGIKVTCELLKAKLSSPIDPEDLSGKIDNIYKKTDQIDVLVSDLFSSTMEDLDELKVACTDESSEVLADILRRYDDRELVIFTEVPKVLIRIDVKRMSQVIGNIIANSYKYADTKIEVNYRLVDDYLEMDIRDFGPGVPEDELNLITNKFYRGRQWTGSREEGSGLGLYIAKTLMEKMDGELVPVSSGEGLMITLMIPLC